MSGYIEMPDWLVDAVGPRAHHVAAGLLGLAAGANEVEVARPKLAELARCSPRTIDAALAELEAVGFLSRHHTRAVDGNGRGPNLYRLHPDRVPSLHPETRS